MASDEEIKVLNELRKNARESATAIAERTEIKQAKVLKIIKRISRTKDARFTTAVDFEKAGRPARAIIAASKSEEAENMLAASKNTNRLSIAENSMLIADIIFENMNKKHEFIRLLKSKSKSVKEYEIVESLKAEGTSIT